MTICCSRAELNGFLVCIADASMGRNSFDGGDLRRSSADLGDMCIPGMPRIKKVSFGAAESPRSVVRSPAGARNYFAYLAACPSLPSIRCLRTGKEIEILSRLLPPDFDVA